MYVTRWGRKEAPLSQFPGWGVEIMMGLYGEQSVREAIEAEKGLAMQLGGADVAAGQAADLEAHARDHADGRRFRWMQRRRS